MSTLARTRTWFGASTNRQILGAAATVAILSLVVRAASLAKDLAVAYRFGTGDALDAFLIAILLPSFATSVVAGSLHAAFVPIFIELRERGGAASADRLFRSVLAVSLGILMLVSVVLALSFSTVLPHLASTFGPSKLALTRELFWWLLPMVVLSGMTTVWTGVLNAGERFALGALAPVAVPAVAAIALVVGGGRVGIAALAGGTAVGYGIAAWAVADAASRAGWSITPRWVGFTPDLRRVMAQYAPVFAAACLMGGTTLTDQAMASVLSPGSVAALSYGNKTVALLTGLLTMSLGTAVLPHFSRMVARSEWRAVRHTLRSWVRLIAFVTIPLTILMVVGSTPIVRFAFERGAFSSQDTRVVALVQAMYVIQIPFYTATILFVRLLTSMQRNRTLFWGTGISLPLNIVLNYVFMQRMGVAGIALSTSVMYVVSCAYLGFMLHRALTATDGEPIPKGIEPRSSPASEPAEPRLRICVVIDSLRCGGAERVVATLANEWTRAGHTTSLVTLAPAELSFYDLDSRVDCRAMNVMSQSRGLVGGLVANVVRLLRLRQEIRTIRPDVIVSFGDSTNVLVLIATVARGIPVVVSEVSDPRAAPLASSWKLLRRLTYRCAKGLVVVQTESVAKWARDLIDPRRVVIVSNPIVESCFQVERKRRAGTRVRRVVALGRLSAEKGFDILIEAFARAAMAHSGWSLVIAGAGPLAGTLRAQADGTECADRIVFAGPVRNSEELLGDSEIFVLSSRFEGFPNALLEGMACGCCVVSTDCPSGPAEIVTSGVDGVLVPVDDVAALAGSLQVLMADGAERRRLGAAAAASAGRYRADGIAEQWIRLLRSVGVGAAASPLPS